MGKRPRRILIAVTVVGITLLGFLAWYRVHFAMDPVDGFSVNDSSLEQHLLIATQGSAFKDAIVAGVVERLRQQPIFIRVIDVSALSDIENSEWDAIVVLHTIEYGKAPTAAQAFVDRSGHNDKIIALSTSGAGDFKINGVDAIASASRLTDVPRRVAELVTRIETELAR
jgi:hypothetical protein